MDSLIKLVADQTGLSEDYIQNWRHKPIYQNQYIEESSFVFPLDPSLAHKPFHKSGIWFKIADWNTFSNPDGIPLPGNTRRGRLTENFKVAPMSEHVKINEYKY
jgi:hypothetical protein